MSGTRTYLEPLPWETRNLGVESFAVSDAFFRSPDERALKNSVAEVQQGYGDVFVQARFKTGTKIAQILEACGFYFVEATVSPYAALVKSVALSRFVADPSHVLPGRYKQVDLNVVVAAASDQQMAAAIEKMAGESFVDDRFHVDHNCDQAIADRRYVLWVRDLLRDAAVRFHVLLLRTRPVAFMASRAGDLLLAGFTRADAGRGLGEFFWLRVLDALRRDGVNGVSAVISVSNTSALNLYARLGFKFREPRSTFHLWVPRCG